MSSRRASCTGGKGKIEQGDRGGGKADANRTIGGNDGKNRGGGRIVGTINQR